MIGLIGWNVYLHGQSESESKPNCDLFQISSFEKLSQTFDVVICQIVDKDTYPKTMIVKK